MGSGKTKINIIPVNNIGRNILSFLQRGLGNIFNVEVLILDRIGIPQAFFSKNRKQYNANKILSYLSQKISPKYTQDINLAILDVDIFVPSLNFVFGLASSSPQVSLISIARLNPIFYTYSNLDFLSQNTQALTEKLSHDEEKIFENRILKEAVHEIGHTLGLKHCSNYKCVMYFSNSLMDTDRKDYHFCSKCFDGLAKCFDALTKK